MAMRRPRIKAVANIQLNAKRKPKTTNDVKPTVNGESNIINSIQEEEKREDIPKLPENPQASFDEKTKIVGKEVEVRKENGNDTTANNTNLNYEVVAENDKDKGDEATQNGNEPNTLKEVIEGTKDALNDSEAFKCPPRVGYQRSVSHTSNSGVDDVFYSDIEENALQMDLQKTPNGFPMSPSKNQTRQRIRPTPHFGQRRNSFVGSSPSPHTMGNDDNQSNNEFTQPVQTPKRERHHSASLSSNSNSTSSHHTPHKYLPAGIPNGSRIRTESGCSVFSDTNTSVHKSRKTDDQNHRQQSRREFEARFVNGMPDKSALKMSDLIYWNPATNPMEQKPNPNVKLEKNEASTNDVKPFEGKKEKDSEPPPTSGEAVPVPQLKLNSNGELILDDKSLVIETTAEQEARKVLANSSLIYLDENTGMNGFYSRQKRTREWPASETIKFYRCLQNIGTDFSLMVSLFPNRTRRDLKLKFKKEERINGHLINKALLYPKQFNIEELKQQMEEEEKAREEEVQRIKILKEKAKENKKRKIATTSVANRVLTCDEIYQNENTQKPTKRTRKPNTIKTIKNKTETADQINEQLNNDQINISCEININNDNNGNNDDNINNNNKIKIEAGEKPKRRRRRAPNIPKQKDEVVIIKEEIIKTENKPDTKSPIILTRIVPETVVYNDVKQLETEMNELLHSSEVTANNYNNTSESIEEEEESEFISLTQAEEAEEESILSTESSQYMIDDNNYDEEYMDLDEYDHRSVVNLEESSLNTFNGITEHINPPTPSFSPPLPPPSVQVPSPEIVEYQSPLAINGSPPPPDLIHNDDTCSSVISERELNEQDIQQILTELAEGSLVLVSTLDPDDPDKVLNEIYMVDNNTGDLCDEPLNIPDNIVQCILSVMN